MTKRTYEQLEASIAGLHDELLRVKELLELAKNNASHWIEKAKETQDKLDKALEAAGRGKE